MPGSFSTPGVSDARLLAVESDRVVGGNLGATSTLNLAGRQNRGLEGTLTANHAMTVTGLPAAGRHELLLTQGAAWSLTIDGEPVDVPLTAGTPFLVVLHGNHDGSDFYIEVAGAPGPPGPPGPDGDKGDDGDTGPTGQLPIYDLIANRPSAASAGDRALFVATDANLGYTMYQVQSAAWVLVSKGSNPGLQTVTYTPGVYAITPPAWAARLRVRLMSGAGGGASGRKGAAGTVRCGGGGGGGPAVNDADFLVADLPAAPINLTVGAGGAGGAAVSASDTDGNPGDFGKATFLGPASTSALLCATITGASGGGTATTGLGGGAAQGVLTGGAGAAASTSGGVGVGGTSAAGGPGGGSGGGINSSNTNAAGGAGGRWSGRGQDPNATAGTAGGGNGGNGTDPPTPGACNPGTSGAGGGGSTTANGGDGGNGGVGAGGGGGGAATNAVGNSGKGGDGGAGRATLTWMGA